MARLELFLREAITSLRVGGFHITCPTQFLLNSLGSWSAHLSLLIDFLQMKTKLFIPLWQEVILQIGSRPLLKIGYQPLTKTGRKAASCLVIHFKGSAPNTWERQSWIGKLARGLLVMKRFTYVSNVLRGRKDSLFPLTERTVSLKKPLH